MLNFVKSLFVLAIILRLVDAQPATPQTRHPPRQLPPVDIALVIDNHYINTTEVFPDDDPRLNLEEIYSWMWICKQKWVVKWLLDGFIPSQWKSDTRAAVFLYNSSETVAPIVVEKFTERFKTDALQIGSDVVHVYPWGFDIEAWVTRETTKMSPAYSIASFNRIAREMSHAIKRPNTGNRHHVKDVVIWLLHTHFKENAQTFIANRIRETRVEDDYVNIFVVAHIWQQGIGDFPGTIPPWHWHKSVYERTCHANMYGRMPDGTYEDFGGSELRFDTIGDGIRKLVYPHIRDTGTTIDPCAGSQETGQCFFDTNGDCKIAVRLPHGCQGERTKPCERIGECTRLCNVATHVDIVKCNADCDANGERTRWPQNAVDGIPEYVNCPKKTEPCQGIKCECTPVPEYQGECYFDSAASCVVNVEMKAPSGISDNARRHCTNSGLLGPRVHPCNKREGECQRLCDNDPVRDTEPCDAECELEGTIKSAPKNRPFCQPKVDSTCVGPPCTCQWEKVANTTIDCHFHDDGTCAKVIEHKPDPTMEERFRQHCDVETVQACEKTKCHDMCNADEQSKDACEGKCFEMGTRRVRSMKAVQNVQYYHNCPETTEPCFNNCTETTTRGTRPSTYTWTTRSKRSTRTTKRSTKTTSTTSILLPTAKQVEAQTDSPGALETWHIILIVLLIVLIIFVTVVVILIVTNSRKRRRRAIGQGHGGGARGRASPGGRHDRSGRGDKKKSPRDAGREQGRHGSRDRGQGHERQIGRDRRDRSEGPSGGRTKPPSRESCQLSKTRKSTPPPARHGSPRPPQSPRARSGGRRR